MYNAEIPKDIELPSSKKLIKSTFTPTLDQEKLMIEFAKIHVAQALEIASRKAKLNTRFGYAIFASVDKESIINAYPLNEIV